MKARCWLGLVLATWAASASAADSTTACSLVFDNGLTSHAPGVDLTFERNAQLLNPSSTVLNFSGVSDNGGRPTCASADCTAGGGVSETLDPGAFQSSGSSLDFTAPGDGSILTVSRYKDVNVDKNATLGVSPSVTEYFMDKVTVESNATLRLRAGDYWIDTLEIKQNGVLEVLGTGTARLFVNTLDVDKNAQVNSPGAAGDPSKLFVYVYRDDVDLKQGSRFSGFLYAEGKVNTEKNVDVDGAISAGAEVKLEQNTRVTFTPAAVGNTDFGCLCSCTPGAPPATGFLIIHDGTGIHCADEPFDVTVVDAAGATVPDYTGQITLSASTGRGTFALLSGAGVFADATADDGNATYQFDPADSGSATFALAYPEGPAMVDVDAAQSDDSSIRDDDSEGLLTFAPSGFTLTGSALPNPPPSPIVSPVVAQTAGSDFSLYLTAYGVTADDPQCGVIESYAGNRSVSFAMSYLDPGSGTRLATVNGVTVNGPAQPVTFNAGQATVTVRYKDVGRIQLSAEDPASFGHTVAGSSNPFVVRPAELLVTRVESAAGMPNPAAASATGPAFVPAGEAFVVDVEARDAEGDRTPNFGLEASAEGVAVSSAGLVLPAGGRNGASGDVLNGAAFAATATPGRFSNGAVVFDEVGVIVLQPRVADGDYLGSGPVAGTTSGNVGRFYPAAFDVLTHAVSAACGTFTYMDEPALGLSYRLQALTTTAAVTQNYDAGLLPGAVATVVHGAEAADDGIDRSARLSAVGGNWAAGEVVVNRTDLTFARAGSPDGAFDPLQLSLRVVDPLDGVALLGLNTHPATSGDCVAAGNCNAVALGGPTRVVYGRLAVLPAYGPENEPLAVALQAQMFQGGAFVANEADDCSLYSAAAVGLGSYSGNLQNGDTSVTGPAPPAALLGGVVDPAAPLALTPPGFGSDGSVEVTLDVPGWLEFDWLGAGSTDPRATLSFGRFRGHDRIIYWSEQR